MILHGGRESNIKKGAGKLQNRPEGPHLRQGPQAGGETAAGFEVGQGEVAPEGGKGPGPQEMGVGR